MTQDWVQLLDHPLDTPAAASFVTDPQAGGIAIFLGTTRAETDSRGKALAALDYDAYCEMACTQLKDLASSAHQRWPICRLAILHRLGRVPLGEPSVIVAVSTPHRADAFEGCRWIIDTLKAQVAIWKKEVWEDGSENWVQPSEGTKRHWDRGTK
jgi:molybdopterin synthase catalytic subunit